jgi:hypothetical protein
VPGGSWRVRSVEPRCERAGPKRGPLSLSRGQLNRSRLCRTQVVLELGTHAEFVPQGDFTVRSFVVEEFPDLVPDGDVAVVALLAKRTFWEKATILHAEFFRPAEKALPDRYSCHYYDLAMLAEGPIRTEALADMELLGHVVRHKQIFYPAAWAHYELASPGSLRLLPSDERVALERDYRSMGVMIFGGRGQPINECAAVSFGKQIMMDL